MWWTLAAAALPYVMGAMQKKPNQPGAPAPVNLPDRSAYMQQMLDAGFNTDSGMYRNASNHAQEQVNRMLARNGLRGSSIGASAMGAAQNRVAQSFIDMKNERMQRAFQQVSAYDMSRAAVEQGNSQAAANYANQIYTDQMKRQAGVIQGVGQTANAIANAYGVQDNRDYWDKKGWGPPRGESGLNYGNTGYGYGGMPGIGMQSSIPSYSSSGVGGGYP